MNDFELTKRCALFDFGCSNAAAKAVLVTLAAKTNSTGRVTGQKVDDLARACCVQRNAFLKAIAWLEEKGLLIVKRHKALASVYIFNEQLILLGRLVSVESVTKFESVESDTNSENLSYESDTKLVMDATPTKLRIHNQVGIESVTAYKKEKIKKEKEDFSLMTDSELVDFFSSVSHEEGVEARAEYTRRVVARNKYTRLSLNDTN